MADNVAARDAFRAVADSARRVAEAMGQRPTKVTIRVRTYSGAVGANGVTLSSTTDTVLDPRPKVAQVTEGRPSYFGGGTIALHSGVADAGVYEIGPITQDFPGGGYTQSDLAAPGAYNKRVTVLLEGEEFTSGGEEFTITNADFTRPHRGMLEVTRTRQGT